MSVDNEFEKMLQETVVAWLATWKNHDISPPRRLLRDSIWSSDLPSKEQTAKFQCLLCNQIFLTALNRQGQLDTQRHLRRVSVSSPECSIQFVSPFWFSLRYNSNRFVPQHGCGSTAYKLRLPVYNLGLHVSLYSLLPLTPLARYFALHLSPKVRTSYRQVCEGIATRRLLPNSCFS
jgi:hypothetical protein